MIKDVIDKNEKYELNEEKIEALKVLFPNAVKNGIVDLKIIEKELNPQSITKEGYELNFLGKSYAKLLASLNTETVLEPNKDHNSKEENNNSENIYISGDNIDALKHLMKSYYKKIKCIYIDPPYNTGSDGFVYNDSFKFSKDDLESKIGLSEEEADRIIKLINSESSSHSAWLTFMYPRLHVARHLLKDDGIIYISIDENELANLKLLCDEIFGENNFAGDFVRKTKSMTNDAKSGINYQHEFVLVYSKDINAISLKGDLKDTSAYKNPDNDVRGAWISDNPSARSGSENARFPIENPFTGKVDYPPQGRYWAFAKTTFQSWLDSGKAVFRKEHKPEERGFFIKKYLSERKSEYSLIDSLSLVENNYMNQVATKEINDLFKGLEGVFSYPKPVSLLYKLLKTITQDDDQIMDFFSGSATTAHATMLLNSEDGGNRKFIMVQLPELINEKEQAFKEGYRTIDQIGRKRIELAAEKIKSETPSVEGLDLGFKHYTIKSADNQLSKLEEFNPNKLFSDNDILREFGVDTVLTTWMNYDGYGLTDNYDVIKLNNYEIYQKEDTIYILNSNITNDDIKLLVEKFDNPDFKCKKVVIFGYSFNMTEVQGLKDNLKQVSNVKKNSLDVEVRY